MSRPPPPPGSCGRRRLGFAPRPPARPLSVADPRQIINLSTPAGRRDTVVILLGFAGALRRSEVAALTLADHEPRLDGLMLQVRRSKTDPAARGQVVGIAHGQHPLTDPTAAPDAWLGPHHVRLNVARGIPTLSPRAGHERQARCTVKSPSKAIGVRPCGGPAVKGMGLSLL